MSRPRHYWYYEVKGLIKKSKKTKDELTLQATILNTAMIQAETETLKLPNGDLRMKAVRDILIDQKSTINRVCEEVNYEERTVQSWISSYVNLVGKKAGY